MNPFNEIYAVQSRTVNYTSQYETYIDSKMTAQANMHSLENAFVSPCTSMKNDVAENREQVINVVHGYFPQP
jgi:hypothetical protein